MAKAQSTLADDYDIAGDIALRIKYWRKRASLRQVDLATALEMTEGAISRWESGSATPSLITAHRIAKACGVSIGIFLGIEIPRDK